MGLSLLFPLGNKYLAKKSNYLYIIIMEIFLFEHLLKKLLLNQKTGTVVPILFFVRDRPLKGQSLERRCSSRTFRYGYLVTT